MEILDSINLNLGSLDIGFIILIVVGVVLLLGGLVFIVRGIYSTIEEYSIVPITQIKEISELTNFDQATPGSLSPVEGSQSVSKIKPQEKVAEPKPISLTEHFVAENLKSKQDKADAQGKQAISSQTEHEVTKPKEEEEFAIEKIMELEEKIKELAIRNDEIEISAQNYWRDDWEKIKNKMDEKLKSKELEAEQYLAQVSQFKIEKDQLTERENELKTEAQTLKMQLEKLESDFKKINEHDETQEQQFEQEKRGIFNQLEKREEELRESKDQLYQLQQLGEKKILKADQTINLLKQQLEKKEGKQDAEINQKFQIALADLAKIKMEREQWFKMKSELENRLSGISDYNEQLKAKEKVIQYELTKSRAQVIGLEQICEDFKEHIERVHQPS